MKIVTYTKTKTKRFIKTTIKQRPVSNKDQNQVQDQPRNRLDQFLTNQEQDQDKIQEPWLRAIHDQDQGKIQNKDKDLNEDQDKHKTNTMVGISQRPWQYHWKTNCNTKAKPKTNLPNIYPI